MCRIQETHDTETWVSGKITRCDFRNRHQLLSRTWRYVELAIRDFIRVHRALPVALVLHPDQVEELLLHD